MTEETLKQATICFQKKEQIKREISNINHFENKNLSMNKVKLHSSLSIDIEMPLASFKAEIIKHKKDLESQLLSLENEFNNL